MGIKSLRKAGALKRYEPTFLIPAVDGIMQDITELVRACTGVRIAAKGE